MGTCCIFASFRSRSWSVEVYLLHFLQFLLQVPAYRGGPAAFLPDFAPGPGFFKEGRGFSRMEGNCYLCIKIHQGQIVYEKDSIRVPWKYLPEPDGGVRDEKTGEGCRQGEGI